MKYCIGCVYLRFDAGSPGYDTECTSGIGAEAASIACNKGHWQEYLYDGDGLFAFEEAMQRANTCPDYEERSGQGKGTAP